MQVDLTDASRGKFLPVAPPATGPQNERNQQQNAGKGLPPADKYVAGLYDVFVFDGRDRVLDFQVGKDRIDLTGRGITAASFGTRTARSHYARGSVRAS